MKKMLLAAALLAGTGAIAQTDSARNKPQFKLSVNYNSNLHYYGRTDSFRSSGFFPMAELFVTPKFYVNAAPIFVSNKFQSLDYAGTVATAGYLNVTDKWITSIYALKPFYTKEAQLVQSALKAQTGASLSRLNKVANLTLGGDVKFSDGVDFGVAAGIDHIFKKVLPNGGGVIVVDPMATINAGTQRFSTTYVKRKAGNNGSVLGIPVGGGNSNNTVTETKQEARFNILSYELSVPVIYVRGKWMLLATPAFVSPQNLLPGEYGKEQVYVTAGLKYTF